MSKKIILAHWMEGGTALTNFPDEHLPIYLEAVKRFGSDDFVVVNVPIPPLEPGQGCSLHHMVQGDCSRFWELFREVKEEMMQTEKHKEAARLTKEMLNRVMKS